MKHVIVTCIMCGQIIGCKTNNEMINKCSECQFQNDCKLAITIEHQPIGVCDTCMYAYAEEAHNES